MKKRTQRIASVFAAVFVVIALVLLLAPPTHQTDEAAPVPITFSFYNADGIEDNWNDPVAQQITQRTGVTLQVEFPSGSTDRIDLMIATGEYPDLIFAKGDAGKLIENHALLDLTPLIDQYGPHIKALYGDHYEELKDQNGAIWQLCSGKVDDIVLDTAGSAQLQWAVLKEHDFQIPYTLERYAQMIRDYMAAHPTIDGKPTIGLSIVCTDWHWYITLSNPSGYIASGAPDNGQWIVENGSASYKHAASGQKEFYRWLNRMYAEGILDSEFAIQTHEDYIEKITQGRVLGLLDSGWGYAEAERALRLAGEEERTYAGLPVTMNEDIPCSMLMQRKLTIGTGIAISASCKDPVRAIQFLDWMCTDEAQVLVNWGIEGINYTMENGKRIRTQADLLDSLTATDYAERTGVGFHVYPFPSRGNCSVDETGNFISHENREEIIGAYTPIEEEALSAWNVEMLIEIFPQADTFSPEKWPPLWSLQLPSELDTLLERLDAVALPGLIDCIVCEPASFDHRWEQLQADLRDAGLEDANRLMNEYLSNGQ